MADLRTKIALEGQGTPPSAHTEPTGRRASDAHVHELAEVRRLRRLILMAMQEIGFWQARYVLAESRPYKLRIVLAGVLATTEAWRIRAAEADGVRAKWKKDPSYRGGG